MRPILPKSSGMARGYFPLRLRGRPGRHLGTSGIPGNCPRRFAAVGGWARLAAGALAELFLTAAGVALYVQFRHAPLQVTCVAITQKTRDGCAVDVTGRIATNGLARTVS